MKVAKPSFHFLQPSTRRKLTAVSIIAALLITVIFQFSGRPLSTSAAPAGIVSLEFARTPETAQAILDSWDAQAKMTAAFGLGLDFLYPLVYATAISLACVSIADKIRLSSPPVATVGIWLAWSVWLAAVLDYVENFALFQMMFGATNSFWPLLAFVCATIKFIFIILALLYALVGWLVLKVNN
ncbi:MAG: hypothetical protein GY796_25510 [Chloroflexi bacterium]|nr:hypothetical protein [Chloroflexota bacterium]